MHVQVISLATITVRNIPDPTKEVLRIKTAQAGVSLEQYVRTLLQEASIKEHETCNNITEIAAQYFACEHNETQLNEPLSLVYRDSKRGVV